MMTKNNQLKSCSALIFFLSSIFFFLSSCDFSNPFYVQVASINGVPDTGTAGVPLALTGTVSPSFATNKDIVWSVTDAGLTGAGINSNVLNATSEGTVVSKKRRDGGTGLYSVFYDCVWRY